MSVYDEKYIKPKVKDFNGAIKTKFLGNEIPKKKCALRLHSLTLNQPNQL